MGAGNPLPEGASTATTTQAGSSSSPSYLKGFLAMALAYATGGWAAAALVGAKFFGSAALGPVWDNFKTWMGQNLGGTNATPRFNGYVPGLASYGIDTSQWRFDWGGHGQGEDTLSDMDFEGGSVKPTKQQPGYRLPDGSTGRSPGAYGIPGWTYSGRIGSAWGKDPAGGTRGGTMYGGTTPYTTFRDDDGDGRDDNLDNPLGGPPVSVPSWYNEGSRLDREMGSTGGRLRSVRERGPLQDFYDPDTGSMLDALWYLTGTPSQGPLGPNNDGDYPTGGDGSGGDEPEEEGGGWEGPGGLPAYTPMTFNPTFLAWQPGNTGNPQFTSGASSSSLSPEEIAALLAAGGK